MNDAKWPPDIIVVTPAQIFDGDFDITYSDLDRCRNEVRDRRKKGEIPLKGLWQVCIDNAGPEQNKSALVILEDQQIND